MPAIPPVLRIVALVVFAATLFSRAVDPLVPKIAFDLDVDVSTAALLSTAFTFPFALAQPVLGTIGDFFGKTRLMNISFAVVVATSLVCAFAQNFALLVAMRVIAGMLAGGIYPVALAMVGDLVAVDKRQVAIARLLAVALTGNLVGAVLSGFIGDLFGWRGVFLGLGGFGLIIAVLATVAFRGLPPPKSKPMNRAAVIAGYRSVFADPRAKVCFSSVFVEGIVIHGLFPYVALLLFAAGQTRAAFAGIVLAGFGLGGIIYSVTLPLTLKYVRQRQLMVLGASLAAVALMMTAMTTSWPILTAAFAVLGSGFYMLHNSIQVHVTDLSQTARGTAMSMHSCFFFIGQALGPIYYGYAFDRAGIAPPLWFAALVVSGIGLTCARFLHHRRTVSAGP